MRNSIALRLAALTLAGAAGALATTGAATAAPARPATASAAPAADAERAAPGVPSPARYVPGAQDAVTDAVAPAAVADAPNAISGVTTTSPSNLWIAQDLFRADDSDFFRFNHPKAGYISALLGDLPDNYYLRLYDSRGTLINTSSSPALVSEELYGYLNAGVYYVRINLQSGGAVQPGQNYVVRWQEYSENLQFTGSAHAEIASSGNTWVYGEVLNNTAQYRAPLFVTVTWLNAKNQVVKTAVGRGFVPLLAPRWRTPFAVNSGVVPGTATHYTVTASAATTNSRPATGVVVTRGAEADDGDHFHFTGTVKNASPTVRRNVRAAIALYNPRGFLWWFSAETAAYSLNPGAVRNYDVTLENVNDAVAIKTYYAATY